MCLFCYQGDDNVSEELDMKHELMWEDEKYFYCASFPVKL